MFAIIIFVFDVTSSGELRVSFAPSTVVKLRRMGFAVLLESGAGVAAGFSDEDYTRSLSKVPKSGVRLEAFGGHR